MKRITFEAGTGRHFKGGVNFLWYEDENIRIYAECPVPEGASEDYGYLTLKKAVEEWLEDNGRKAPAPFWYDGQESYLEQDASEDCEVKLDCKVIKDAREADEDECEVFAMANLSMSESFVIYRRFNDENTPFYDVAIFPERFKEFTEEELFQLEDANPDSVMLPNTFWTPAECYKFITDYIARA